MSQLQKTAIKYDKLYGKENCNLLFINISNLNIKWENEYPHVYGTISLYDVIWVSELSSLRSLSLRS